MPKLDNLNAKAHDLLMATLSDEAIVSRRAPHDTIFKKLQITIKQLY